LARISRRIAPVVGTTSRSPPFTHLLIRSKEVSFSKLSLFFSLFLLHFLSICDSPPPDGRLPSQLAGGASPGLRLRWLMNTTSFSHPLFFEDMIPHSLWSLPPFFCLFPFRPPQDSQQEGRRIYLFSSAPYNASAACLPERSGRPPPPPFVNGGYDRITFLAAAFLATTSHSPLTVCHIGQLCLRLSV